MTRSEVIHWRAFRKGTTKKIFSVHRKITGQSKRFKAQYTMATLDSQETRQKIKYITSEMQKADWEGVENGLYEMFIHIQKDYQELSVTTPRNHDIAALIQEMRNGFAAMDKRFEAMDKRFDDLIHQMDRRFSLIQWFMGIGFTFFAFILTYGTFFK